MIFGFQKKGRADSEGLHRILPVPVCPPDFKMISQQGGTEVDCSLAPKRNVFRTDLLQVRAHAVYLKISLDTVRSREKPAKNLPESANVAHRPGKSTDKQQNKGEKQ